MKISSVRIQNLRSFTDSTIPLNDYTCFVGPNGSGKSTILYALNVFFRESNRGAADHGKLDCEDFHHKDTSKSVCITVTFTGLSQEAKQDLAEYVRQDRLIVSAEATFDEDSGKADVRQYGQRLAMADFKEFFRALGDNKKVADLKQIYSSIRNTYSGLPAPGTKDAMIESLRTYEAANADQCEPLASEDQFYGFSKGTDRLAKYIQWVYVPAVKDATTEQVEARNTALGRLLARTARSKTSFETTVTELRANVQRQYQSLLNENQSVLDDISQALQARLSSWAHPDATLHLQWKQDPDKSVRLEEPWAHIVAGEGGFEGELGRFGHGFQRSYLLALLQELATGHDETAPSLILACEEPELYQHPPQARHMAAVLHELSRSNTQVLVSTHHPLFVSGEGFEDVRMVRKDESNRHSTVSYMTYDEIAHAVAGATGETPSKPEGILAKIHQALQPGINEMFFTRRLILVEGPEDVAYLFAYINLLDRAEEYRRMGCHIVAVNGKSQILQPLVIAKHMGIPVYVVFDADADKEDRSGSRAKHEKDNKALLTLLGKAEENAMSESTVWGPDFVMWHSDIGSVVRDDIGEGAWAEFQTEADRLYDQAGNLRKNALHIGASLALAWNQGMRSSNLERVCAEILSA